MGHIFVLQTMSAAEEYIRLEGDLSSWRDPYQRGELQFFDRSELRLGVSEDGGIELPDVFDYDGILFVSNRLKQTLDEYGTEYVYCKRADIVSDRLGIHESAWMLLPPRLDCLDLDRSSVDREWDFADGVIPFLRAERIVIQEERLGRFEIFKIAGLLDNKIYLTDKLCRKLQSCNFRGAVYQCLQ